MSGEEDSLDSQIGTTKYQLFIKGVRGQTYTIIVHKDATIEELFKVLEKKTGVPPDEARLIHAGKELQQGDNKMISNYPEIANNSTLFMVLRLHGGEEHTKELDDLAPLTDEPDMITWDDDPEGKRAKMPCGHAISPDSLTAYCRSLLSVGKFQFFCPYAKDNERCNREWTYIEVRRFGVLKLEEQKLFETKISENYLRKAMGIQECPGCLSLCERIKQKDKRLICRICTKEKGRRFEFCWLCLHEWKSSGIDKCGNEECSGEDPRLRTLRETPLKDVIGVQTPSTRACPSCGTLIAHTELCKHMVCPCGTNFCFICLKVRAGGPTGTWACGTFNTKCSPATRQTEIPGQ